MSLPNDIVPDRDEARRRQLDEPLLASVAAAADGAGLACPDAETLGLYAEQSLARQDAAAVAVHVRGCARCQDIVAAIARATPGAVVAAGEREPGSTGVAGWLNGWRWLVPALSLAGAAAVAVWLGGSRAPEMQIARTDATPPDSAAAPTPPAGAAGAAASRDLAPGPQMTQAAPATPKLPTMVAAPPRRTADTLVDRSTAAPTAPAAAERQTLAEAVAEGRTPSDVAANTAAAAPARPPDTLAFAPAAPPPPRAASIEAPAPAAAAPQAADAEREERARSQALGRAKQAVPQASGGSAAQGAADFRAPYARWRVRDGVLEFARDGRAWRRVAVPTDERLSSVTERPDASVLVITASGAEFVSTDLGATWQRQ